jgi:eukaryotic-like serine/threonine-protein kinase
VFVLVAAGVAGYLLQQRGAGESTLSDSTGTLWVTVPHDWERAVAREGWESPTTQGEFPALSVGTGAHWVEDDRAEGVFVGILPGTELPERVPQHPEGAAAQEPVDAEIDGDASQTVTFTGCPGGVVVERVVLVAANRLLWVQIRSADRATANAVLDDVDTRGI